jgi:type IV pilus biogenesis protein CpaD/CtpE
MRRAFAMGRVTRTLVLLAAVAGLTMGCARHAVEDDAEPEADLYAPTPLTVENNNWLDVVIFVFHDGELSRVGTVTAASSTNFFLPNWMIGQSRNIRLLADPIGSDASARTETLHIQPGQFIEWRLESQLARSTVAVY